MTGTGKRQRRAAASAGLRPQTFDEIIGQAEAVEALRTAVAAAARRREMPGHVLLTGPAGTGKTTLAGAMAHAIGGPLVPLYGVHLRRLADVIDPLLVMERRSILFVDEIHRMYRPVQEVLFTVMEDGALHLGREDDNRVVPLPPFTLVGATTDPERLLTPMLDRFATIVRLRLYAPWELMMLVEDAAPKLGVRLSPDGAAEIARMAEGVPRVALRLLRAARDQVPDGAVGLAEVEAVLRSPALVWRSEGRSASDR
jgi:holliday junction DNA helicase RuvB